MKRALLNLDDPRLARFNPTYLLKPKLTFLYLRTLFLARKGAEKKILKSASPILYSAPFLLQNCVLCDSGDIGYTRCRSTDTGSRYPFQIQPR